LIFPPNPCPNLNFDDICPILFICTIHLGNASYIPVVEKKREVFERKISETAGKYIGIRYEFGGDFEKSGAVDNSHLFCLIYAQAAEQSGLVFAGYMPMDMLLKNTVEVERNDLKIGDLKAQSIRGSNQRPVRMFT
jgi:hypothetical protein